MRESTRKAGTSPILSPSTKRRNPRRRKAQHSSEDKLLLSLFEATTYLQIVSVPVEQRVNPKQNSYILLIQPHGVRAAGGQYTADEAHEIAKSTRGWDWSLDENQRPKCLPQLERLLDQICKRSAQVSNLNTGGFSTKLKKGGES
jgi:hypothetical protein